MTYVLLALALGPHGFAFFLFSPVGFQGNLSSGLLKRYILQPFETWLLQHQNKGKPPFARQCSGVSCKDP